MKFKRSTVLPIILFIYLCFMAWIGYGGLRRGEVSLTTYIITIVVTLALIITLHFFLKRRERLRDERMKDMEKR